MLVAMTPSIQRRPLAAADSLDANTALQHRCYARLAAMGLNDTGYARLGYRDVDEVQWTGKRCRSVVMCKPLVDAEPAACDPEHPCAIVRVPTNDSEGGSIEIGEGAGSEPFATAGQAWPRRVDGGGDARRADVLRAVDLRLRCARPYREQRRDLGNARACARLAQCVVDRGL
jgi:hypothetical protein